MTLKCPEGHTVEVRGSFSRRAGELICPEHRKPLIVPQAKTTPKRSSKEQGAAKHFAHVVCAEPCFFSDRLPDGTPRREGHQCRNPLDPHHLIPKSWIENYIDLPEDELIELKWNPIIGAPLCRNAHDAVEYSPAEYIYRDELSPALIIFCEEWDAEHPELRSLLGKLYERCPER